MEETGFKLRQGAPVFVPRGEQYVDQSKSKRDEVGKKKGRQRRSPRRAGHSRDSSHIAQRKLKSPHMPPNPVVPEMTQPHMVNGIIHSLLAPSIGHASLSRLSSHGAAQHPFVNMFSDLLPALYAGRYDEKQHKIDYVEQRLDEDLRHCINKLVLRSLLGTYFNDTNVALSFKRWPDIWLNNYLSQAGLTDRQVEQQWSHWVRAGGVEWLMGLFSNDCSTEPLPFVLDQVVQAMPYRAMGLPLVNYFDLGDSELKRPGLSDHAPIFFPNSEMIIWNVAQQAGTIEMANGGRYNSAKFRYPIEESPSDYLDRLERLASAVEAIFLQYPSAHFMLLQEVAAPLFKYQDLGVRSVTLFTESLDRKNISILIQNHQAIVWRKGAMEWAHAFDLVPNSEKVRGFRGRISTFRRKDNRLIAVSCHGQYGKVNNTVRAMSGVAKESATQFPGVPVIFAGDMNCMATELARAGKAHEIGGWEIYEPDTRLVTHSIDNEGTLGSGPVDLCCVSIPRLL